MVATLAAAVVAGLALLAGASPPGAHAARPAPRLRGAEVQGLGAEVTASDLDLVKKLDDQFAQAYNGGACCLGALRCGETPLHPQREPAFPPSAPLSCPFPWSFLLLRPPQLQSSRAAAVPQNPLGEPAGSSHLMNPYGPSGNGGAPPLPEAPNGGPEPAGHAGYL